MREEDYWEVKNIREAQYYEAKLAIEKLVAKAEMLRHLDKNIGREQQLSRLYEDVGKIFLNEIPG